MVVAPLLAEDLEEEQAQAVGFLCLLEMPLEQEQGVSSRLLPVMGPQVVLVVILQ
jgi:hypothetical protein